MQLHLNIAIKETKQDINRIMYIKSKPFYGNPAQINLYFIVKTTTNAIYLLPAAHIKVKMNYNATDHWTTCF